MLPVHGFVLAGGKSARMGLDKALLQFRGKPMVAIAVEKLQKFCAEVSIAGNRDDLSRFAPVVGESRAGVGPAAGIEAGLKASGQAWAVFLPVDVPLVPAELLRNWVENVSNGSAKKVTGSYLLVAGKPQPTFCILMKESQPFWSDMLERGERRLEWMLARTLVPGRNAVEPIDAAQFISHATSLTMESWFRNVNTPEDLIAAEAWAKTDRYLHRDVGPLS